LRINRGKINRDREAARKAEEEAAAKRTQEAEAMKEAIRNKEEEDR
jgi:hypothetical protein